MDTLSLRNRPAYTLDRETASAMWLKGSHTTKDTLQKTNNSWDFS
jgi:hypothetical protein